MRVCMVCPAMGAVGQEPIVNGYGNNTARLARALAQKGHQVTIITSPSLHSATHAPRPQCSWAEVVCLPTRFKYPSLGYGVEFAIKALRAVRKLSPVPDILHGHSGYPMFALIPGVGGKLNHIPSLHTIYFPLTGVRGWRPYQLFSANLLARLYLSWVNLVITLGGSSAASLTRAGVPQSKLRQLPPSLDGSFRPPSVAREKIRGELGLETDCPLLLYVGDLTRRRGTRVLVRALKGLRDRGVRLKLLLAVNMPLSQYYGGDWELKRESRRLGVMEQVQPVGIVEDMPKLMAASDCLVAPFLTIEGIADYPLSILEAMAVGIPVIATTVGGIPEVVQPGKNGLLVAPGDEAGLSEAILYLVSHREEALAMGAWGARFAAQHFNPQKLVDRLEELYSSLRLGFAPSNSTGGHE